MKRIILLGVSFLVGMSAMAQSEIQLPTPELNANMSLFQSLLNRKSVRAYMDKDVDNATLSALLWAAAGISRPAEGKITAASAINAQDIQIYVCKSNGAYRWDPANNLLTRVTQEDLRADIADRQTAVAKAPVMLVLVSNQDKFGGRDAGKTFGHMDAGYVSQNIYLASAALGLGTVARWGMNRDSLKGKLKLTDNQVLELNHPVGWLTEADRAKLVSGGKEKLPFHFEAVDSPSAQPAGSSSTDVIDIK